MKAPSRKTTAKIAIKEIVEASDVALSHAEIRDKLDGLCDRVTIYRVLDRLTDEGLVHKVVNVDGVVKYANCNSCEEGHEHHHHNHVHFNCERCHSVMCLDHVEPRFELPEGYVTNEVNFTISGLCPDCAAAQ